MDMVVPRQVNENQRAYVESSRLAYHRHTGSAKSRAVYLQARRGTRLCYHGLMTNLPDIDAKSCNLCTELWVMSATGR